MTELISYIYAAHSLHDYIHLSIVTQPPPPPNVIMTLIFPQILWTSPLKICLKNYVVLLVTVRVAEEICHVEAVSSLRL